MTTATKHYVEPLQPRFDAINSKFEAMDKKIDLLVKKIDFAVVQAATITGSMGVVSALYVNSAGEQKQQAAMEAFKIQEKAGSS